MAITAAVERTVARELLVLSAAVAVLVRSAVGCVSALGQHVAAAAAAAHVVSGEIGVVVLTTLARLEVVCVGDRREARSSE